VGLHQVLNGTEGIGGGGDDSHGGHRVAHPQIVNQHLGKGDLSSFSGIQGCGCGGHVLDGYKPLPAQPPGGAMFGNIAVRPFFQVISKFGVHDFQTMQPAQRQVQDLHQFRTNFIEACQFDNKNNSAKIAKL
jgi:hypothetical protein